MLKCPHCQKRLSAESVSADTCPHCGQPFDDDRTPDEPVSGSSQTFVSDRDFSVEGEEFDTDQTFDEGGGGAKATKAEIEPHEPPTIEGRPPTAETLYAVTEQPGQEDGTAQTFVSEMFSEDDAPATGAAGTEQTFVSDAFDIQEGSGFAPTIGVREDDLTPEEMRSLQDAWSGMLGDTNNPTMSIKARDDMSVSPKSTLVIKSRVMAPVGTTSHRADAEYELQGVLGRGGMGVVYDARQTSVDRAVAIKMLKDDISKDERHRQKFLAEAVVTGELDHPNVVPIYDLGVNDKGTLFYSMKQVEGTPWQQEIKSKSTPENIDILLRVADAVAFAHSRGVVHRDLKPENVMLGEFGEVLVMDWGLAQPTSRFRKARSIADIRAMGGTPSYMAPELATGPIDRIGPPSDIYLLGAILYEILEGRPPHVASTVSKCLIRAARNRIEKPKTTGELIDIAMMAMATQPDHRYQTVQEFQQAIRNYQEHIESIELSTRAAVELSDAEDTSDYDKFAKAIFRFEEAADIWQENQKARTGGRQARLSYAACAVERGDLDLAASLLDEEEEEHRPLLVEIAKVRGERERNRRRLETGKRIIKGLAACVFAVLTVAFALVWEARKKAEREKVAAEVAEGKAIESADEAEEQRKVAAAARDDALKQEQNARDAAEEAGRQRDAAEMAKQVAVTAQMDAETQRSAAELARMDAERERANAVDAKAAEEYEAYLALIGLAAAQIQDNAFSAAKDVLDSCDPKLRNWEWRRLKFLCSIAEKEFSTEARVQAIALSPDETQIASGGHGRSVVIHDTATRQVVEELAVDAEQIFALEFSPDGRTLAIGCDTDDAFLQLWRKGENGQWQRSSVLPAAAGPDRIEQAHQDAVLSVEFSQSGKWLLSSSFDNTARVWDVATGTQLALLRGHTWWVWDASFCPSYQSGDRNQPNDETRIVTCSQDRTVLVWTDESQRRLGEQPWSKTVASHPFRGHEGPVYAAAFSRDGNQVASGGSDGRILLWEPDSIPRDDFSRLAAGDELEKPPYRALEGHTAAVRSLEFSHKGDQLVSGGYDNEVRVWSLESMASFRRFRGHGGWVRACRFSKSGRWVYSGSYDGSARQWGLESQGEIRAVLGRVLTGHMAAVLSANFSFDGTQIVTASQDRTAKVWQSETGTISRTLREGHEFLVSKAVFFGGGRKMLTAAVDDTVRFWDVATATESGAPLKGTGRTAVVAISSDEKWILTGGNRSDGFVAQVWKNSDPPELLRELGPHTREVTAVAFSPVDPTLAFTGDGQGRGRLWNITTGERQANLFGRVTGQRGKIVSAIFTRDGRRLLTASTDGTVAQWNPETAERLTDLTLRHPAALTSMTWLPNGNDLLTASRDGVLRVWNIDSAEVKEQRQSRGSDGTVRVNVAQWMAERGWRYEHLSKRSPLTIEDTQMLLGQAQLGDELIEKLALVFRVEKEQLYRPILNSIDVAQDGRWLAVNSADRIIYDWDADGQLSVLPQSGLVWAASFAPGDKQIVTVGGTDARLIDADTGEQLITFSPHSTVASASFSPNGQRIVTGSWDHTAKVWDAHSGRAIVKLTGGHSGPVNSCVFSPDVEGRYVLTASDDATAILWELTTERREAPDGKEYDVDVARVLRTLRGHEARVGFADFSPDGRLILTVSDDGKGYMWSTTVEPGQEDGPLCVLDAHEQAVVSGAISADNKKVITGSEDGTAIVWELSNEAGVWSATPALTLSGHSAGVTSVAFSPWEDLDGDGQNDACALRAATGSRDTNVKLWDVSLLGERRTLFFDAERADAEGEPPADGPAPAKEILTLRGHNRQVTCVRFSPDGNSILSASRDGRALLWLAAPN